MIHPGEIQKKAFSFGVRDQQIEKDYVLSWILKGVSNHSRLDELLIFKGGTVLKKFYFKDYRFSEDLDFTIKKPDISNEQIFQFFKESFEYIIDEANIPLEIINDKARWSSSLNEQIKNLPDFEQVDREVQRKLKRVRHKLG